MPSMPARLPTLAAPLLVAALALLGCEDPPARLPCEPGVPCEAASAEVCAHGLEATLYGRAAFAEGTCVARDEATCRASAITCAHFGQCAFSPTPRADACRARADRDLLASRDPGCTRGTCVAVADADCANARVCREEGRCTAKDNVCVATAETCRASSLCQAVGFCSVTAQGTCRAATPADCVRTEPCERFGACAPRDGRCVPCESSSACRSDGACELVGQTCRATSDLHCRAAEVCRSGGRCRAFQGACVR